MVSLTEVMPAALDLVRRSSFVAPDRSLTVLRASVPKDYLDEIIWRIISDNPDAYVKDRLPAVHSSFKWKVPEPSGHGGLPPGARSVFFKACSEFQQVRLPLCLQAVASSRRSSSPTSPVT